MATIVRDPIDPRNRVLQALLPVEEQSEFFRLSSNVPAMLTHRQKYQAELRRAFLASFGEIFAGELAAAVRNRQTGAVRIGICREYTDEQQAARFGAAVACVCGTPYAPPHAASLTAANLLQHVEAAAPGTRTPYRVDPMHTDTHGFDDLHEDFILVMCQIKFCAEGGASRLLHLDDWAELQQFVDSPAAAGAVRYAFGQTGAIRSEHFARLTSFEGIDIRHRALFWMQDGRPCINLTRGYMHPESGEQAAFIDSVCASADAATHQVEFELGRGDMYLINNCFWLHGRKPIERNEKLYRRLFQFRGQL